MSSPEIVVYGSGLVARSACKTLVELGAPFTVIARRSEGLDDLAATKTGVASIYDHDGLARAFAGAKVVLCAAGPLRETAEPVLAAAVAAGANYVDVGGEQAVLRSLVERHDSTVRRAGLVAIPGSGVDAMLGDLAASWATSMLLGGPGGHGGPPHQAHDELLHRAPPDRLADAEPLDDIATSYVFDDFVLSAGSQRALFGSVGEEALAWRAERWEPVRAGSIHRVNLGKGGEREAIAFGGGDAITIPRHVAARSIASYRSVTRNAIMTRALGLFARAIPYIPRRASDVLAPSPVAPDECARTKFSVVSQVRRGFDREHIAIHGMDPHATTGVIAAWCAHALAKRDAGPVGMRSPSEVFRGEPALHALVTLADLAIETSFS